MNKKKLIIILCLTSVIYFSYAGIQYFRISYWEYGTLSYKDPGYIECNDDVDNACEFIQKADPLTIKSITWSLLHPHLAGQHIYFKYNGSQYTAERIKKDRWILNKKPTRTLSLLGQRPLIRSLFNSQAAHV